VEPRTELFVDTPLRIGDGIIVNKYLETNMTGVYAAGDVANYYDALFDKRRRLEHWDSAVQQSQHVVHDMMSRKKQRQFYMYIPYYFSDVFDLSYEFWGDIAAANMVVHRGAVDSGSFSVWWLQNNQLVAGLTLNRPDEEREIIPEWIQMRPLLQPDVLADESQPLTSSVGVHLAP
jgi:3-phenylpropionate/trans-cinnamate dioxygenase ferredoxin reductase component